MLRAIFLVLLFLKGASSQECDTGAQCVDNNPCTIDFCDESERTCLNIRVGNCVPCHQQPCDDSDPCTIDTCDPVTKICSFSSDPMCCLGTDVSSCPDDDNACTETTCVANRCTNEYKYGALGCIQCATSAHCNAPPADLLNLVCVKGTCNNGQCSYQRDLNCCTALELLGCDDGNVCTTDTCNVPVGAIRGTCAHAATDATCTPCGRDEDCTAHGSPSQCTKGVCDGIAGRCKTVGIGNGCCTTSAQCPPQDCKVANCAASNALAYKTCSYVPDTTCAASCTTNGQCAQLNDPTACKQGVCRSGSCATETVPGCCKDDTNCKPDEWWCTIGKCVAKPSSPFKSCEYQQRDIYFCKDPCLTRENCKDLDNPNTCTFGYCSWFRCMAVTVENCCKSDTQCNDNDKCTTDKCVVGRCVNKRVEGQCKVCTRNDDCKSFGDLIDKCTQGVCNANGLCEAKRVPECCAEDTECKDNDNNECTVGKCEKRSGDLFSKCYSKVPDTPQCTKCTGDAGCAKFADLSQCKKAICSAAKVCSVERIQDCCLSDSQCNASDDDDDDDERGCSNKCVVAQRNDLYRKCVADPTPICTKCKLDVDCRVFTDADKCQTGYCLGGSRCAVKKTPNCCLDNDDCKDRKCGKCNKSTHVCFSSCN